MKPRRRYQSSFLVKRSEKKAKRRLLLTLFIGVVFLFFFLTWALPMLIGSLSILNKFKPLPKKEVPISENATISPPVLNIPFEATSTAKIIIKGYATPASKVEIYVDQQVSGDTQTDKDGSFTIENINLNIGTNNIYGQTVDEKGNKSLPSKPIFIIYNNEKPTIEINEPTDNQVIKGDKEVKVSGKTHPQDSISVSINGSKVIVDGNGHFSQTIEINDGENNIIVIAKDIAGNTTQLTRKIIFEQE